MSSEVLLGDVTDLSGETFEVLAHPSGTVMIRGDQSNRIFLGPLGRDALRGLLDRAAMPGQTYRVKCCDHCNNLEGDPAGHDYVPGGSAHDGPCGECAAEKARREHDEGTG